MYVDESELQLYKDWFNQSSQQAIAISEALDKIINAPQPVNPFALGVIAGRAAALKAHAVACHNTIAARIKAHDQTDQKH